MLTTNELAVLGLVAEQPSHGYELEQAIEHRGMRSWTDIAFSSIYYVLNKLEERGLVRGGKTTGAKARRVFRVTAKGRRAAAAETKAMIAGHGKTGYPILVGLANVDLLSSLEYRAALTERRRQIDERIATVTATELAQEPLPRGAAEVFSFSLAMLEAERAWVTDRIGALDG